MVSTAHENTFSFDQARDIQVKITNTRKDIKEYTITLKIVTLNTVYYTGVYSMYCTYSACAYNQMYHWMD